MRLAIPFVLFVAVLFIAYAPGSVEASPDADVAADTTWSWPAQSENLQVLPADTPPERLREVMRGFTRSLGVRCEFCHVGEPGTDFLEWDFAADDKPMKGVARGMMEMTWQINTATLPGIDGLAASDEWRVTCWTCHRGARMPES